MDRQTVLETVARSLAPQCAAWSADLPAAVEEWIGPDLDLVGDAEWGAQGRDMVGLPVEDPLLWANRFVTLPDGHWAVAGSGSAAATSPNRSSTSSPRPCQGRQIVEWATPSDADALTDAAEQGLLFEARAGDRTAGIVAVEMSNQYGLTGHLVQEICLATEFRGRGNGAALLRSVASRLPADSVLWGHINAANTPSLKNAVRVGREVVGGHVWVTPNGYRGMS
ncbi:hypothetical protein [Mariniluteicoccus flavus]